MRHFRVMLEGENFLLETDGVFKKYGFFTTRYVMANDEMEAEKKALDLVKSDDDLKRAVRNEKTDPPNLYLKSIDQLVNFRGIEVPGRGYSFYAEEQQ